MSNKLYVKSGYVLTLIAQSVSLAISMLLSQPLKSEAQSVIPAPDGTGTQVRIHENQIQIYGGSLSSDEANLFHSLQQFGLTEGQIANFIANPNLNNIVTRITGGAPSVINGVLQVTGGDPNLFLMNPSGIIFGATAQLNLPASFAATTANGIQFGNQWFSATGANNYGNLVGNPTAFYFDSNAGTIINAGNLAINPQHSLLFLGGSVINTGQLSVPEGQVLVTAVPDRNVLHLQVPGNILTLEVKLPDELASQPHVWTLPIAALPELLTSEAVTPELLGLAITDAGDVQLAGSNMRIPNQAGTAIVSGVVDVSGERGGNVGVLGNLVGVVDAQVDASGTSGGGTVLVGGEYRGQGTVPTAERTYVGRNSAIAADALTSGDGGRVIVWADGATAFYGGITARGGATSGNGGFAEVSGREYLVFDGTADLSSISGATGTLLLDPLSITIANNVNNSQGVQEALPRILESDFHDQDINISQTTLESVNGNIHLQATNSITIGNLNLVEIDSVSRPTLTLNGDIEFIVNSGDFIMDTVSQIRTIDGGSIRIEAQNIQAGFLRTDNSEGNAGLVNLIATQGNIEAEIRAIVLNDSETVSGNGGGINLTAENGSITVNNNLVSFSANGDGGDIILSARDDIVINCNTSANYCVESFAGGISGVPPRGDSGNISFTSREGSVIVQGAGSLALNSGNLNGNAGDIEIKADTSILIGGIVNSNSNQTGGAIRFESEQINLIGDLRIRSSSEDVVLFNGSIDSAASSDSPFRLIFGTDEEVKITVGEVIINGNIGRNVPLNEFSVDATNLVIGGDVITSGGNINLSAPVNLTNSSELRSTEGGAININSGINSGNNGLTLTSDSIEINGVVTGSGNLLIQPNTTGVVLGNTSNNSSLNLTANEISLINGFNSFEIDAGANPIEVISAIAFNVPTTLSTESSINVGADISTLGQNLAFGNVDLDNSVQISTGLGAGNLTFLSTISGISHDLTLEAGTGQIRFVDTVDVNALNILSAQALLVETGIITNNTDLIFNVPVILTGDTVIFSTQTNGAGNIIFNNALNSEANEINNLELTPGTGNVTFNSVVGTNNRQRLGNITLGQFNTFTNNSTLRAASLQQTPGTLGQTATLSGNINTTGSGVSLTTTGDITANNLSRTGGSTTLVSRNGNISVTNLTATGGNFSATANSGVTATTLNNQNGGVNLRSGAGNVQATDVTAAGDVTAIANTGVTASNINSTNGDVTLRSSTRNVQATDVTAAGDVTAIANTGVIATNIDSGGDVTLRSNTRNVEATDVTATGDVTAIANTGVVAERLNSTGGDVTLRSGTANVQATDISAAGDVAAIAARNITATDINSTGGRITAVANNGAVQVNNLTSNGDVSVTALGTIRSTNGIISNGGNISLNSPQRITTEALTSNGGDISLSNNGGATGSVQVTGDINASGAVNGGDVAILSTATINLPNTNINTSGRTGAGGDITLQSTDGSVIVRNLTATGNQASGGNVSVIASALEDPSITITTGEINTSSIQGNGGNVLLDPFGDVQVSFINAQGGTNGVGGTVDITSINRFFRATDSFIDQNGINASISAAGGAGEGRIIIRHNGGDLFVTFDVFNAALNGTAGALTTGANNIIFQRSFPGSYTQGNIDIITSDRYTLALADALPDAEPDDLQLADADQHPFWLDEYFTRSLEEYLNRNPETAVEPARVKSLEEIQDDLREIERLTGARPALIYVVFEPEQIRETLDRNRNQSEPTQDRLTNQGLLLRMEEADSDQLQLVLVTADEDQDPILKRVPITRKVVTKTALRLRQNIFMDQANGFNQQLYLSNSQQMYQWLIQRLRKDLKRQRINNLVFIMDNGLRTVPLAALSSMHNQATNQFLIEEGYSVGLMPSFSLTDSRYNDIRNVQLMSVGVSDFELFPPLPAAGAEVNLVQRIWGDSNKPLEDEDVTLENLVNLRNSSYAGIIHLATHAEIPSGNASEAFIQLFFEKLQLHHFQDLEFDDPPVELVVLSACQTGVDISGVELGFAGLSVQLGVKSSIASVWPVSDAGTLILMLEFYQELRYNQIIKAEALRRAQIALLEGSDLLIDRDSAITENQDMLNIQDSIINVDVPSDLSHPYYWAGFTIVGNPW